MSYCWPCILWPARDAPGTGVGLVSSGVGLEADKGMAGVNTGLCMKQGCCTPKAGSQHVSSTAMQAIAVEGLGQTDQLHIPHIHQCQHEIEKPHARLPRGLAPGLRCATGRDAHLG